ncbi:hypothetical protein OEZ86_010194 [Tetradesmus obliquus]|nr:hypothetical protein OEZ86_010194 [Tetradesmus obliquus]
MRALVAFLFLIGALETLANRAPTFADTNGLFLCKRCTVDSSTPINPKKSLRPASDGSCGCAPGWYINPAFNPRRCAPCLADSYCPGGTEAESSAAPVTCPNLLVTVNLAAPSILRCVNKPGFSYVNPDPSTGNPNQVSCPENTFSAGLKRQAACTPCPSGMKTDKGLPPTAFSTTLLPNYATTFDDGAGSTQEVSALACLVPPGWYVTSSNKVVRCPKGEFRETYVSPTSASANKCLRCPRGTTTNAAASPQFRFCDVLVRGFYWVDPEVRPGWQNVPANGIYTSPCAQSSYCPGGYPTDTDNFDGRFMCPNGLWTKNIGATADTDCLIPPGHKLALGTVTKCSNDPGEYAPTWRRPGTGADSCKVCGSGIQSDDVEPLGVFGLDASGFVAAAGPVLKVPQTSASCFIEKGQGTMLVSPGTSTADPVYRAVNCVGNNYGVANKQYELRLSPCKDCPTNMQTDASGVCYTGGSNYKALTTTGKGGFFDPGACCTKPGWGYDGVRASICAAGTYNPATSEPADKCKDCPPGTTTNPSTPTLPSYVDDIMDCSNTLPGFGAQSAGDVPGNPAGLQECPIGTFSTGFTAINAGGNCVGCPLGKSTRFEGATRNTECDVCPAGQGSTAPASVACAACPVGQFGDISRPGGTYACSACPGTAGSSFNFQINNSPNTVSVNPVSEGGATSAQSCLLEFAAIEADNWYLPTAAGLNLETSSQADAAACMTACRNDVNALCEFFTYDYLDGTCYYRKAGLTPTGTMKIAYKVLAGNGLGSENRKRSLLGGVKRKEIGSGIFSWFDDDEADQIGDTITTMSAANTVAACLQQCNDEAACAAVVLRFNVPGSATLISASNRCVFKRGIVSVPSGSSLPSDSTKRTMVRYRTEASVALVKPPLPW